MVQIASIGWQLLFLSQVEGGLMCLCNMASCMSRELVNRLSQLEHTSSLASMQSMT